MPAKDDAHTTRGRNAAATPGSSDPFSRSDQPTPSGSFGPTESTGSTCSSERPNHSSLSSASIPDLTDELASARDVMVDRDLAGRDITDQTVLDAMRRVRRDLFIPESVRVYAYDDTPLRIGCGQTISQPYVVAFMTQTLGITPGMRVLEIGTGSGYQTAVLVELGAEVFTIERHDDLSLAAEHVLDRLGYGDRVTMRVDDGTLGWPEEAPFDRILVTAAGPKVPSRLTDQLADGGRLLIPVGEHRGRQDLVLVTKIGDTFSQESILPVSFVPLVGADGF
ncbi:MAG: protein-L-isoaspartate(D-aspartate) O-methyltransferase [Planctomycetaceae bacterium]|nr:protein-L-isoaspartate(D-aspartate) O-methyltransferase [Planctomycetaceae bacterium]